MQINISPSKPKKRKNGFMDKAVVYCLLMCTVLDAAILALYWHSATAPDSLAIAAMAVPWTVEFGAMASIKNKKTSNPPETDTEPSETDGEGE